MKCARIHLRDSGSNFIQLFLPRSSRARNDTSILICVTSYTMERHRGAAEI